MLKEKIHTFLTNEQADAFLLKCGQETISKVGVKILEEYLKTPVKKLKGNERLRPKRYYYVVSLYVSDEMHTQIKNRAKWSECSISTLVRNAIIQYLDGKILISL